MKPRVTRFYFISLAVILGLGVVLWYRYYYDPQVATYRAMPKGHHLVRRVDADVDGDGKQEVVFTSGPDSPFVEGATPATVTVLHWQRWRWQKVWSFTDHKEEDRVTVADVTEDGNYLGAGEKEMTLRIEDINGDGRKEIIFRSVLQGGSEYTNYFHLFGYRKGQCVSLLTRSLWHFIQGGVVIKDFDPKRQGKEILCWTYLYDWEHESRSAPHRYYAVFLAWDGSRYKPYKWVATKKKLAWDYEGDNRTMTAVILRTLLNPSAVIVRSKPRLDME